MPGPQRELPDTQREFLRWLRHARKWTLRQVSEQLAVHGYPCTRGRIGQFEGRDALTSQAQLAYCRAFDLDDSLRLHLQRLAGEAAGCHSLPATEEAA